MTMQQDYVDTDYAANAGRDGNHKEQKIPLAEKSSKGAVNGSTSKHLTRLLVWSGTDDAALKRVSDQYKTYFGQKVSGNPAMLDRLSYTLAARRSHMLWRTYTVLDVSEKCEKVLSNTRGVRAESQKGLAFVFTGQYVH